MPRNNATSIVRRPTLRVCADGVPVSGAFEARVSSNNFYSPDRFSIRLLRGSALNQQPDYLALPTSTTYDLQATLYPEFGFTSLLTGRGDSLTYDHLSRTIRIDGRDLSAAIQDSPASEVFSNLTSSEIITRIASRHNLTAVVTATSTLIGRYYHDDTSQAAYNQFHRIRTDWDLIVFLAKCENFDTFVSGTTLFFQPMNSENSAMSIMRPADLMTLHLKRRLHMAGDIMVTVKSWGSKGSTVVSQTAISRPSIAFSTTGSVSTLSPVKYSIVQPNLSVSDATKLAMIRVEEVARHEQSVEFTMPGELILTPRDRFMLEGTNSSFDQEYQIDTIERTISTSTGFLQRLSAHGISTRQIILSGGDS